MTNVTIEGNIGSGKSRLLEHLKEELTNVIFLDEPTKYWDTIRDKNGNTMLAKFYENQDKYAFSFQMMAFISRLSLLRDTIKLNPGAIIITERSLYTDKEVFAKMLFDSGKIEDVNYQIYLKWFDNFAVECPIHKTIYVKTDPEICQQRILKRLRLGEENIPLEYLKECDLYHENMLSNVDTKLVLNGNIDVNENKQQINNWIDEIKKFINV